MAMRVSFGGAFEYERLPQFAAERGKHLWTLAKDAQKDDTVVFYIKYPVASFVATGRVLDNRREDGAPHGFPGQEMGKVGDFVMLPREVRLRDARDATPGWAWLRQPHTNMTVPAEHEKAFRASLGLTSPVPRVPVKTRESPEETAKRVAENMRNEKTQLGRSRNRTLRSAVIKASNGSCAACVVNYQKVEPLRWTSLLQAHHKKPLHELSEVTLNGVADLVALCPTCHVLAHLGKSGVRTVAQVRRRYRQA